MGRFEPRVLWTLAIIAVVVVSTVFVLGYHSWTSDDSLITSTITISGDSGLASSPYVTEGEGTPESPYVIEGLRVVVSADGDVPKGKGISLSHTNAHLIVRNVSFELAAHELGGWAATMEFTGVYVSSSSNVTVVSCTFHRMLVGIDIISSSSIEAEENSFTDCHRGVRMAQSDRGESVTLSNNTFDECDQAILMDRIQNTVIVGNYIRECRWGIWGDMSGGAWIEANNVSGCGVAAIFLQTAGGSTVHNNSILLGLDYDCDGIVVRDSSYITVSSNCITVAGCGILVADSSNITLTANYVKDYYHPTTVGIGIFIDGGASIAVTDNAVWEKDVGIVVVAREGSSVTARVHGNRFVGNGISAIDAGGPGTSWDDGIAQGNYWTDYEGVDLDEDGIGDSPYVINPDSMDHYPIMEY